MSTKDKFEEFRKEIAGKITGKVLIAGEPGYEAARELWNGAVKYRPRVIVLADNINDIQIMLRFAALFEVPFSVKGGGHDWAGRSLNNSGVVLSLQNFRNVEIDVKRKVAIVQGGATAGELIAAAEAQSLVAVTGTVGAVGFAGLTLGGGYGPLGPSYGLAADNLLSAEIVLATGEVVTASDTHNPDLYWAIRGGGGNFGVVTTLHIRLHDAKPLLSGMILFPWEEAETVLEGYAAIMDNAPDELAMFAGMLPANDGSPTLFLLPAWNGDVIEGQKHIDAIKKLGNPFFADVKQIKYTEFLAIFDPHIGNGLHYSIQTRWLPKFDTHAILEVITASNNRTSPLSFINIHHFHGAETRVPLPDTAFGIREAHFMMEFIATWDANDASNSAAHEQWAHDVSNSIAAQAFPGGYANLLGPDEHSQIEHAFGINLPRLQAIKQKYDKHNIFKGISIPPKKVRP
jgi:FAD/FMN-containing dehydrogenase